MSECPSCGNEFSSDSGMKSHHKQVHGKSLCNIDVECSLCGDEFSVHEYKTRRSDNLFCSNSCKGDYYSKNGKNPPNLSGENHPQYNRVETVCDYCDTEMKIQPHKKYLRDSNFCDNNCRSLWQSENIVGENHHQWSGGGSNYKSRWKNIRIESIVSANGRCEKCDMAESDHYDKYGFGFHVHHIIPLKTFDSQENAHRLDNLMTLCVQCHMDIENSDIYGGGMEQGQQTASEQPTSDSLTDRQMDEIAERVAAKIQSAQ